MTVDVNANLFMCRFFGKGVSRETSKANQPNKQIKKTEHFECLRALMLIEIHCLWMGSGSSAHRECHV